MKKKRYVIIAVVLIGIAAIISGGFMQRERQKARNGPFEIFVVKKGTIHESIEATGEIKPCTGAEISLGARVTGMVVKEPIKIGDRVKKGDLIAVIDNRELQVDVEKAKAELQKVEATYDNAIKKQEKELERQKALKINAERELEATRQELSFAKWDLNSQKALFSRSTHSTSEKALRKAEAAYARSKANFQKAKDNLRASELAVEKATYELKKLKDEYPQALAIAQANLERARIRFSYSTLRAPFSGVISYVSTQEGETVVAGLNAPQFVKILDDTKIENRIYVDETEIGKVRVGQKVRFKVDTYVRHQYSGTITQIYPAPILQNNVVYYIAVVTGFDNEPRLRIQMTTHNEIFTKTRKDVLMVPNSAVRFKDGHYVVIARINGKKKTVPVEIGASDSKFTEIKAGIKEGQEILYQE